MLRSWAERAPHAEALVSGEHRLSYASLLARAETVAATLQAHGVGPGQRVALLGSRHPDTLCALFGIALSGATFVALDLNTPSDRLCSLLQDAEVRVVLSERSVDAEAARAGAVSLVIAQVLAAPPAHRATKVEVASDDVAYVMYTSGSTGRPKGVPITHRQMQAFFHGHLERARLHTGARCLSTGPFHFDVIVMDTLLPLYVGATVIMPCDLPVPSQVLRAIQDERVTHLYAVGTVLSAITGNGARLERYDLSSLVLLQTGAEVCNPTVVNAWLSRLPQLAFLNSYGPTEATVGCVSFFKPSGSSLTGADVPIGRPHKGTTIVLCDVHGKPVSEPHCEGEILIGGAQVMNGYLHRPDEDALAFTELDGERYYRSGDMGFWDEHDLLHYVGRRDGEVKIDGVRTHLNEVQRALHDAEGVEALVVGVLSTQGTKELVAVWTGSSDVTKETLHALLARAESRLPRAMRPSRWVRLERLPQLPSGKADVAGVLARVATAIEEVGGFAFEERARGLECVSLGARPC